MRPIGRYCARYLCVEGNEVFYQLKKTTLAGSFLSCEVAAGDFGCWAYPRV
jgi:hypothetical protein